MSIYIWYFYSAYLHVTIHMSSMLNYVVYISARETLLFSYAFLKLTIHYCPSTKSFNYYFSVFGYYHYYIITNILWLLLLHVFLFPWVRTCVGPLILARNCIFIYLLSLDIVLYYSIFAIYLLLFSVKECAPGWGLSYPARIWCVCVYIVNNSSSCILYYCMSSDRTIHYRNMCYLILFTIHII